MFRTLMKAQACVLVVRYCCRHHHGYGVRTFKRPARPLRFKERERLGTLEADGSIEPVNETRPYQKVSIFDVSGFGPTPTRHYFSTSSNLNIRTSSVSDSENNDGNKPPSSEDFNVELDNYDPKKDTFFTQDEAYGSKENKGLGEPNRPVFIPEEEKTSEDDDDLTTPTNCCGTGCPNCVWIEYVEKLSKKYTDPGLSREKILEELEQIDDDNIKAYIMMELRIKKLI